MSKETLQLKYDEDSIYIFNYKGDPQICGEEGGVFNPNM
jgi:hypothetical protein